LSQLPENRAIFLELEWHIAAFYFGVCLLSHKRPVLRRTIQGSGQEFATSSQVVVLGSFCQFCTLNLNRVYHLSTAKLRLNARYKGS
jgi:hypothetical protein